MNLIDNLQKEEGKNMKKPYVIAEAGVNFYDTAKKRGVTPLEEAIYYVDQAK